MPSNRSIRRLGLLALAAAIGLAACARPRENATPSSPPPSSTMTAPPAPGALDCRHRRVGIAVFDSGSRDREQVLPVLAMVMMRGGILAYRVAPSHDRIVIVGAGSADEFARARTMAQNLGLVFAIEDTGSIGADCRVVFDHPPPSDPVATDPEARER